MSEVAVLGLGAMGSALAAALLDGGHTVTVWNRTAARAAPLAARGADTAATAADALRAAPIAVLCLTNDAAVRENLIAAPGVTLVNLTNSTPDQDRDLADWAARHEMAYLGGGIMAVPPMIGTPAAFVFYSGDAETLERHRGLLEHFGRVEYAGADAGRAAVLDLALLTAMYGMFGGFLHAAALLRAEDIPVAGVEPAITAWLTAMAGALPDMATAIDSDDHAVTASAIRMQALAYPNLLEASRERGLRTDLVEPMGDLLTRAAVSGHGDADLSVLAGLLREGRVSSMDSPREVFLRLVNGVCDGPFEELSGLYAEETDVSHPFHPLNSPPLRTRAELHEHFTSPPPVPRTLNRKPVDVTIHETTDPEVIVAEFAYQGRVEETGETFRVPCVFVLRIRDGLIIESRDYIDHIASSRAWGRLDNLLTALRPQAGAS